MQQQEVHLVTGRKKTIYIAAAGIILILALLVLGTVWTTRAAQKETTDAVQSVSSLYLNELAGRREQVVAKNLKSNINVINIALGMIDEKDLRDLEHLQTYQRDIKQLFGLERFAFVDSDGLVYTADEGVQDDIDKYSFDYANLSGPSISVTGLDSPNKKGVIAVPIEEPLDLNGKQLVVCFMEQDMDTMLQGIFMKSQKSDATFCNIYTKDGIALSNMVLGGLAAEDNLLDALEHAEYEGGASVEAVKEDFAQGKAGEVSFTYNGIRETLSYVPVEGTDWLLTYLIRDSVISERISSVSSQIILRSLVQLLLTALLLVLLFGYILYQSRKNAKLLLEKETAETENRIKNEEMVQRLALQDQLLAEKARQEEQSKMITALASDYRSVYFLELDKDKGICYQSRTDLHGFQEGERFNYLEAVTDYCNHYVLEQYREEFLRFIQPEAIIEGLKHSPVISYRYIISVDGKESYEAVRFARVHDDEDENLDVNNVGACFADIDAETRQDLEQQQALTEALASAEQASKAKTAFLSSMSHEIRTPMNAIIGLNNIALNEPDVPDKVREYLEKTGNSAQHLLGIINDILDMSRIESGKMVIKNEEFSFAKNLEQVNTIISGQCSEKGLQYECRTSGKIDDYYVGDGGKLKQVMINILGNAVKFTPEGGSVTFLVEEGSRFNGQATLKFTISDTGIGMSPEYLPHVFDTFSQEDSSTTNKYGSTGLGMPITKNIVELMNGSISVESEKGVGTTFTVTIPFGESDHKSIEGLDGDLNPAQLNVLVIDDDQVALDHAQITLKQVGIHCDVALSGEEGLRLVELHHGRNEDYDLLLIDWKMPDMDGVETTRKIRSIVGHETPIIILTSYNWDEVADEAREAGVDTFVPKPLFAASVMDEFRQAFNEKRRELGEHRADLSGRHILLAEDMEINAEIITMILAMREISVDLAENGRIAVDKFTAHEPGHYDAVLMDMRMPEMDGLEATRTIRASGRADAATIPIIALTANAFDEDVQRSLQAGLNAHLSKPVEPDALFDTLEKLIR